jgi:hypothetical protein
MVGPPDTSADSESMDSDPDDRGRGVLTPKDRAFLRGEAEYEAKSNSARRARQRIRDRIRNAVLDFGLIAEVMQDRDRETIFERGANDDLAGFNDGLLGALWFIYGGVEHGQVRAPTGLTFTELVERAVRRVEYDAMPDALRKLETVHVDVDVSVDRPSLTSINAERVASAVERGRLDEISDDEARSFLRWLMEADALDAEAAVDAVRDERDRIADAPDRTREGDEFEILPDNGEQEGGDDE